VSWIKCIASGLIREIYNWSLTLKIGTGVIGVLLLLGILAPWLTPYDPFHQDYTATLVPPCWPHPFGTDQIGRDILTRVLYGIRVDMTIGFFTTFVPMTYGVVLGAYAGLLGGRFDAVMMRLLDIAMAFPFLVLIIVIISILGPGTQNIYIAVFLVAWTMYTRLSRAEMMVEVKKEYILAARTLGYGKARIVFRHALPNIINSSIVFSMSDFVLNILLVSGLSFLGLGVQPPTPEWGAMVAEGRDYIMGSWWISTLPGLMIVITGTALAFIGDGLAHRLGERRHTLV
jgi:peptide/nickel transport system permease protein